MGTIFLYAQINSILDPTPITIICILLFCAGYWVGNLKSKKLMKQLSKMEKKVMDLNSELLYGPPAQSAREKSHSR